jgi:hypothetical protein
MTTPEPTQAEQDETSAEVPPAPYDPAQAVTGLDAWTLAQLNQLDPITRNRALNAHR